LKAEGRGYLETSLDNYDIVFVDSSEPMGPSLTLHERSFFELVKDRLAPSGVACAIIPRRKLVLCVSFPSDRSVCAEKRAASRS